MTRQARGFTAMELIIAVRFVTELHVRVFERGHNLCLSDITGQRCIFIQILQHR